MTPEQGFKQIPAACYPEIYCILSVILSKILSAVDQLTLLRYRNVYR